MCVPSDQGLFAVILDIIPHLWGRVYVLNIPHPESVRMGCFVPVFKRSSRCCPTDAPSMENPWINMISYKASVSPAWDKICAQKPESVRRPRFNHSKCQISPFEFQRRCTGKREMDFQKKLSKITPHTLIASRCQKQAVHPKLRISSLFMSIRARTTANYPLPRCRRVWLAGIESKLLTVNGILFDKSNHSNQNSEELMSGRRINRDLSKSTYQQWIPWQSY